MTRRGSVTDYHGLARELAHLPNLIGEGMAAGSIAIQLQEARNDGLEEAAKLAEDYRLGEQIVRQSMGSTVELYAVVSRTIAAAVRSLKGYPPAGAER
jgi:hypothetical protein